MCVCVCVCVCVEGAGHVDQGSRMACLSSSAVGHPGLWAHREEISVTLSRVDGLVTEGWSRVM